MDLPIRSTLITLEAQSGAAFLLPRGQVLRIVGVEEEQVADLALFNAADIRDSFSPGRTIDYNERIRLATGDVLYSHRSTELARIVDDTVCVHDILLAPCSAAMFARRGALHHPSCHENLSRALHHFGIGPDGVTATLNVFMDVRIDQQGRVGIYPPPTLPGDVFAVQAACDLIVGLAACSSELTNNGRCKAVAYELPAS